MNEINSDLLYFSINVPRISHFIIRNCVHFAVSRDMKYCNVPVIFDKKRHFALIINCVRL